METSLIQLGGTLGGFAGLCAMVLMVFVLRQQASGERRENARLAADADERKTQHIATSTYIGEIVAARRESNTVIEANTRAMTMVHTTVAEMCAQLGAHDDHARDIGTVITRMEGAINQVERRLPVRQYPAEGHK